MGSLLSILDLIAFQRIEPNWLRMMMIIRVVMLMMMGVLMRSVFDSSVVYLIVIVMVMVMMIMMGDGSLGRARYPTLPREC